MDHEWPWFWFDFFWDILVQEVQPINSLDSIFYIWIQTKHWHSWNHMRLMSCKVDPLFRWEELLYVKNVTSSIRRIHNGTREFVCMMLFHVCFHKRPSCDGTTTKLLPVAQIISTGTCSETQDVLTEVVHVCNFKNLSLPWKNVAQEPEQRCKLDQQKVQFSSYDVHSGLFYRFDRSYVVT